MPKFRIGRPQLQQSSVIEEWESFKTLDQRRLIYSLCIGVTIGTFIAFLWRLLYSESLPFGSPSWTKIVLSLIVLIIGHEVIHLLGFPYLGMSSRTVVGLWLEAGSPYVQHMSPIRRNRFLAISILPFFVLSVMPLVLAAHNLGTINYLSWISVLNCLGAGSDIFIFIQILRVVPSKANVIEGEDALYWRG